MGKFELRYSTLFSEVDSDIKQLQNLLTEEEFFQFIPIWKTWDGLTPIEFIRFFKTPKLKCQVLKLMEFKLGKLHDVQLKKLIEDLPS